MSLVRSSTFGFKACMIARDKRGSIFGHRSHQVGGGRGVVMQGSPAIENLALPGMLEGAEAVAGDPKGKDVDTLIGGSTSNDLRRHVERGPRAVSGGHERGVAGTVRPKSISLIPVLSGRQMKFRGQMSR